MRNLAMAVFGVMAISHAKAAESGWLTFKTIEKPVYGAVEYQMDRSTIRQDGRYKTFWARQWIVRDKQPLAFSVNEHLNFLSQKFAVDCTGHQFGSNIVDSNNARDRLTLLAAMRWRPLDAMPMVTKAVCGEK